MFCLQALAASAGQRLPIFNRFILGKDLAAGCHYVCTGPGVARKQAELYLENQNLFLVNLSDNEEEGSAVVLVNKQPISNEGRTRLRHGDVLQCGNDAFTIQFVSASNGSNGKQVERAREKIARLVLECERIKSKDQGCYEGLSEGQKRTLERNDGEIANLERQIFALLNDKEGEDEEEAVDKSEENVWEVPESALLDKTAPVGGNGDKREGRAQTYASLLQRKDELEALIAQVEADMAQQQFGQTTCKDDEEEDELDLFMAQNEQELKGMDLEKHRRDLQQYRVELAQCDALARLAKPSEFNTKSAALPPVNKQEGFRIVQENLVRKDDIAVNKRQQQQQKEEQEEQAVHKQQKLMEEDEEEETVSAWQPPTNQTGDGRSTLNKRFGY